MKKARAKKQPNRAAQAAKDPQPVAYQNVPRAIQMLGTDVKPFEPLHRFKTPR